MRYVRRNNRHFRNNGRVLHASCQYSAPADGSLFQGYASPVRFSRRKWPDFAVEFHHQIFVDDSRYCQKISLITLIFSSFFTFQNQEGALWNQNFQIIFGEQKIGGKIFTFVHYFQNTVHYYSRNWRITSYTWFLFLGNTEKYNIFSFF